jgi:protoporphyrinogen oxidase
VRKKVLIIGAGPAGLAAAYEFLKQNKLSDFQVSVFEADSQVGGLAKTIEHKGFRFDLGGHRFYTKYPEIDKFYSSFLKKDMLERDRLSRIYYQKKFFDYPLNVKNALSNLGLGVSVEILISWLARQFKKYPEEKTFDTWVSNRFGDKLFSIFFKSYSEKVWGIKTSQLSADWAAQRIQNFNLFKAVVSAVTKTNQGTKTLIKKFYYPKYGPGMLYEKMLSELKKKEVAVHLNHQVLGIKIKKGRVESVDVRNLKTGKVKKLTCDFVISTMPFDKLIISTKNPKLTKLVKNLKFRNFISVNLVVKNNPFPDQWIYIHDPSVKVGRIQNFRNWSPFMTPDDKYSPIGMEYFASENDNLWRQQDKKLVDLAKKELVAIGLAEKRDIVSGFVYRAQNAYPIYNFDYDKPLRIARAYFSRIHNLFLCGRGGLFRYNNQDHSMLTGFYVARNIIAGKNLHDVWSVNDDATYLEKK